mmetsp:Transcript_31792/g.46574  ORF Transcript_31792/g.46574 Transcript_31792/m.46574 type:complete len:97 (-) Transcript_31792:111-401(-)
MTRYCAMITPSVCGLFFTATAVVAALLTQSIPVFPAALAPLSVLLSAPPLMPGLPSIAPAHFPVMGAGAVATGAVLRAGRAASPPPWAPAAAAPAG